MDTIFNCWKTGTAQVKSIVQGKRYNEAALSSRQWDHGLFVGFAPADNPEIAIVVWENGNMAVPRRNWRPVLITG